MPGKNTLQRRIDRPGDYAGGAAIETSAPNLAPPAVKSIPEPEDLIIVATISRSASTPTAMINAGWSRPSGTDPQSYVVQVSEESIFPANNTTTYTAQQEDVSIDGLKVATTYYVRVAAVYRSIQSGWSESASVTTPNDTTPAAQPTALTASWAGAGDLVIKWTKPTSPNFKDVEITIRATNSSGTILTTQYSSSTQFVYSAEQNVADSGGTRVLHVTLRSRTWSNVINSTSAPTTTATKPLPALGSFTQSWASDPGTAASSLVLRWSQSSDTVRVALTLDGVTRSVTNGQYNYTLAINRTEHSGTADREISYSLVAIDGLGAQSTTISGAATNAAPPTTSATLSAGVSTIAVAITPSTAADFDCYIVRILRNSVQVAQYVTSSPDMLYKATDSGSYQVAVRVRDQFGQLSSETTSSAVVIDALTIEQLRASAMYSDVLGTAPATLKNALSNDNRNPDTGILYAANSAWRWIQFGRALSDRYRQITLAMNATGTTNWYIRTSEDGSAWNYFAGPVTNLRVLTAVASESAAQAAAVSLTILGQQATSRVELPTITEARYVELWFRNTAQAVRVNEYYPRRLVQSDDIEAEAIRAINIAANAIDTDKLTATAIDGMTITGSTIRTSATGARVVLSSAAYGGLIGYNASDTYNPSTAVGTYQVLWDKNSGALYAGGGNVKLDAEGIVIAVSPNENYGDPSQSIRFKAGSDFVGQIRQRRWEYSAGEISTDLQIVSRSQSALRAGIDLRSEANNGSKIAQTIIGAYRFPASPGAEIRLIDDGYSGGTALRAIEMIAAQISAAGPFYVNGQIYSQGSIAALRFADRSVNNTWGIHANNNKAYFWNGSIETLAITQQGNLEIPQAIALNGAALTTSQNVRTRASANNASNFGFVYKRQDDTANNFYVAGDGSGFLNALAWTYGSDIAWKQNIRDLTDGLTELLALRPRIFDYIDPAQGTNHPGFIAQEIDLNMPNLIQVVDEEGHLGVKSTNLIPYLVRAVQQLYAMTQDLHWRLKAIEEPIEEEGEE